MKKYKTINVLVDGAGGDVGQGVIKLLEMSNLPITIYTSCVFHTSSWLHKIKHSYVFPFIDNEGFIDYLISFLQEHNIQVYFPTVDSSILKISQYKKIIEERTGCLVFVDEMEKIKVCDDKYKTIEFLQKFGFYAPLSILPKEELIADFIESAGFPFIAKTRSGHGANEVFLIKKPSDYKQYINNLDYMFQEYIPHDGGEYTSGIYLGEDSEIKGICTFKRELKNGSTYKAERIVDDSLELPLKKISQKLGLKYLNIQSMKRGGTLYPFEFNGRFSGTTGMVGRVFNAPEMFIEELLLGKKIVPSRNKELFFVARYYEEVYSTKEDMDLLTLRSRI